MDVRELDRGTFGVFHAVASLGAFEHYCSPEHYRTGRQEEIYLDVFARAADVLPAHGRLYLQTMVWGRNMVPIDTISADAPPESDAWYLMLMHIQFPGSFLPFGAEQVTRAADPYFDLIESSSGRLDYIETIKQWRAPPVRKARLAQDANAGSALAPLPQEPRVPTGVYLCVSANSICFERELLDHFRLVFEKP